MNSMLGNYFVYEPGTHKTRVQHNTRELAEAEACRLCNTMPGKRFYVLKAISVAHISKPVVLTRVEDLGVSEIIEQAKYADGDL